MRYILALLIRHGIKDNNDQENLELFRNVLRSISVESKVSLLHLTRSILLTPKMMLPVADHFIFSFSIPFSLFLFALKMLHIFQCFLSDIQIALRFILQAVNYKMVIIV